MNPAPVYGRRRAKYMSLTARTHAARMADLDEPIDADWIEPDDEEPRWADIDLEPRNMP